jgi:hypothetical protein
MVQDQDDVKNLFEALKVKNSADIFVDPAQGGKDNLPPIIYNAFRATTAAEGVPRTTIHQLTPEEIESRGLCKAADTAQKACREFWTRGGRKSKKYVEKYGGKINDAFGKDEMTKAKAKEHFLRDFESDSGLAKDAEPLRELIWKNRDVFGDDILQIKEGIISYEVEFFYTLDNLEPPRFMN